MTGQAGRTDPLADKAREAAHAADWSDPDHADCPQHGGWAHVPCQRCGVLDPETVRGRPSGEVLCGLCAATLARLRPADAALNGDPR